MVPVGYGGLLIHSLPETSASLAGFSATRRHPFGPSALTTEASVRMSVESVGQDRVVFVVAVGRVRLVSTSLGGMNCQIQNITHIFPFSDVHASTDLFGLSHTWVQHHIATATSSTLEAVKAQVSRASSLSSLTTPATITIPEHSPLPFLASNITSLSSPSVSHAIDILRDLLSSPHHAVHVDEVWRVLCGEHPALRWTSCSVCVTLAAAHAVPAVCGELPNRKGIWVRRVGNHHTTLQLVASDSPLTMPETTTPQSQHSRPQQQLGDSVLRAWISGGTNDQQTEREFCCLDFHQQRAIAQDILQKIRQGQVQNGIEAIEKLLLRMTRSLDSTGGLPVSHLTELSAITSDDWERELLFLSASFACMLRTEWEPTPAHNRMGVSEGEGMANVISCGVHCIQGSFETGVKWENMVDCACPTRFEILSHNDFADGLEKESLTNLFCGVWRKCGCCEDCPSDVSCECRVLWSSASQDSEREFVLPFSDYRLDTRVACAYAPVLPMCSPVCQCGGSCGNTIPSPIVGPRVTCFRHQFKGWCLRCEEGVPRGTLIGEYVGEVVPLGSRETSYILRVENESRAVCEIDAEQKGGVLRYVAHSCVNNCTMRAVIAHGTFPVIALFATRDIRCGEEITFRYHGSRAGIETEAMMCACGQSGCLGVIPV